MWPGCFIFVTICADVASRRSALRGSWHVPGSAWVKAPSSVHPLLWLPLKSASLQTSRYCNPPCARVALTRLIFIKARLQWGRCIYSWWVPRIYNSASLSVSHTCYFCSADKFMTAAFDAAANTASSVPNGSVSHEADIQLTFSCLFCCLIVAVLIAPRFKRQLSQLPATCVLLCAKHCCRRNNEQPDVRRLFNLWNLITVC